MRENWEIPRPALSAALLLAALAALAFQPLVSAMSDPREDLFTQLRHEMVTNQIESRGVSQTAVVEVMREVPRHLFIPERLRDRAYFDAPQPIGSDQTISQPYIVALMTANLELDAEDRILEIGTGSGYQAAVLSRLVEEVFSIEIRSTLARRARSLLSDLGYDNVDVRTGDGYEGWPEEALRRCERANRESPDAWESPVVA